MVLCTNVLLFCFAILSSICCTCAFTVPPVVPDLFACNVSHRSINSENSYSTYYSRKSQGYRARNFVDKNNQWNVMSLVDDKGLNKTYAMVVKDGKTKEYLVQYRNGHCVGCATTGGVGDVADLPEFAEFAQFAEFGGPNTGPGVFYPVSCGDWRLNQSVVFNNLLCDEYASKCWDVQGPILNALFFDIKTQSLVGLVQEYGAGTSSTSSLPVSVAPTSVGTKERGEVYFFDNYVFGDTLGYGFVEPECCKALEYVEYMYD